MDVAFHQKICELKKQRQPFAIVTVINVKGSASAKPGSKALVDSMGHNILGWVGGGVAERFVGEQAVQAIAERASRIVEADLDDEIFGLGMPCGGVMEVFIEPQLPPQKLRVADQGDLNPALSHLASALNLELEWTESPSELTSHLPPLGRALVELAQAMALARGLSGQSLRQVRGVLPDAKLCSVYLPPSEFLIFGHSRITEELARFGALLKWPTRVISLLVEAEYYPHTVLVQKMSISDSALGIRPGSVVIVASHDKEDHLILNEALRSGASYAGLIASPKRAGLVLARMRENGFVESELDRFFAPAGIEMNCLTPTEIALSCLSEVLLLQESRGF